MNQICVDTLTVSRGLPASSAALRTSSILCARSATVVSALSRAANSRAVPRPTTLLARRTGKPSLSGEESGLWAITEAPLRSASFPSTTRREESTMNE